MFSRYVLRTTDLDAALRFYEASLGLALPRGPSGSSLEAWPLHEQARSRGAPAHWLGHAEVDDVEASAARLVELGGERLGPTVQASAGTWATLRDPWGAVIALRARGERPSDRPIAWHQLHTRELERAWAVYAELLGWADAGAVDVPDPEGGHRLFAWNAGDPAVGSVANTARWQGVHAHWLFHFAVDDLEGALERVRAHGGTAMGPFELPDGRTLAACEDPQGAAFGLVRSA